MTRSFRPSFLASAIAATIFTTDSLTPVMASQVLEEVVVTARKKQESLQDVPVVVTAFDSNAIEKFNAVAIDDLAEVVPGMSTDSESGASGIAFLNIRGIESSSLDPAIDQSVSMNVDGVQFSNGYAYRLGNFDLEQVEILKGPQALFFGKNSPGGIIAIKTANPTDEYFSQLQVGYETAAERPYFEGIVSGPLSDNLGGRLAVGWTDSKGYFDNQFEPYSAPVEAAIESGAGFPSGTLSGLRDEDIYNDRAPSYNEVMARGTLRFENDTLDATFKLGYSDRDGDSTYSFIQAYDCDRSVAVLLSPNDDCRVNGTFSQADPNSALYSAQSPLFDENPGTSLETVLASFEVNTEINEFWSMTSVTGWNQIEAQRYGSVLPGYTVFVVGETTDLDGFSQEVRFIGEYDRIRLSTGAFYEDRKTDNFSAVALLGPKIGDTRQIIDAEAWSVFAQVEADITDTLRLSIGGRYSNEEKNYRGENVDGGLFINPEEGTTTAIPAGELVFQDPNYEESNFSPEVTLSWGPLDNINTFISYKEAFKSGGFEFAQTSVPTQILFPEGTVDNSFDSETVDGFEAGVKMDLLENTLRLNLAAYTYEYQNLQLASYNPQTSGTRVDNAGSSKIEGFEVEALYLPPVDGLTLFLNTAYVDAKYQDFIGDCHRGHSELGQTGCNIDRDNNVATSAGGLLTGTGFDAQDRAGTDLPRVAEWAYSLGGSYEGYLTNTIGFRTNLTGSYTGEQNVNSDGSPFGVQDAYWVVHGSLGVFAEDESWSVDLIVRNLLEEEAMIVSADEQGFSFGTNIAPREVMVQFTIRPELLNL